MRIRSAWSQSAIAATAIASLLTGGIHCQMVSGLGGLELAPGEDAGTTEQMRTTDASRRDAAFSHDAGASDTAPTSADAGLQHTHSPTWGDADSSVDAHQAVDARSDAESHEDAGHPHTDAKSDSESHPADAGHEPSADCGVPDTVDNCGICGASCNRVTASSVACSGGSCAYTCNAGWSNCNTAAPDTDGCECQTPGCCGTGCEFTHANGEGQSYYDCVNPGEMNATEAMEACVAYTGSSDDCSAPGCGLFSTVCSTGSAIACICWTYSGTAAGHVYNSGKPGGSECICPSDTDATWN